MTAATSPPVDLNDEVKGEDKAKETKTTTTTAAAVESESAREYPADSIPPDSDPDAGDGAADSKLSGGCRDPNAPPRLSPTASLSSTPSPRHSKSSLGSKSIGDGWRKVKHVVRLSVSFRSLRDMVGEENYIDYDQDLEIVGKVRGGRNSRVGGVSV